jgi:hypothetical protein
MMLPRHRLDLVERPHEPSPASTRAEAYPEPAMMPIHPISTRLTLLMAVIVLAAPIIAGFVIAKV